MILSAGDLTLLRESRHATRLNLCVYVPPTIWYAQVDGAQTTGDTTITVKGVVNTRTPSTHFQVLIGSALGLGDYGEARWRGYAAPTLSVSYHNAPLPNNAWITVKEVVQPQAIHLGIIYGIGTALDTYLEDNDVAYTNENTLMKPVSRCGTHAVIYLVNGVATGKFYSRSETFPTAGGGLTYLWYWRGGTVTVGSTATAGTAGVPNSVTWNTAGDYYCSLTVTDASGKSHTRYFVVFVRDSISPNIPQRNLQISGMAGDERGIWSADLEVFASATEAVFPKNALCVISADDYFGGTAYPVNTVSSTIGTELYRENILLAGYIQENSVKQDWVKGSVSFKVENLASVLGTEGHLAGDLETDVGATIWHSFAAASFTYNQAAHHILMWHTTANMLADLYFDLPDFIAEFVTLPEGALSEQLTPICNTVSGRWGGNAMGHIYLEPHPQYTPVTGRSTTYTINTTLADLRAEIDFGTEQQGKTVSKLDFWGEDEIGDPWGSWAPPFPWPTGLPETIDGIRVADQTAANQLAGLYEAYKNLSLKDVIIPWRGNYRVFDVFPASPIAVTAPTNLRGINWVSQRCWIKSVSYDTGTSGVILVNTTVEMDISGSLGVSILEPEDGVVSPYPIVFPTLPSIPPFTWGGFTFPSGPPTPPSLAFSQYDIWDGIKLPLFAGETIQLLNGVTTRRVKFTSFNVICDEDDVTLNVYFSTYVAPMIIAQRVAGAWTIARYTSGGVLIGSPVASGSARLATINWTGASIITLATRGIDVYAEVVVDGDIEAIRWSLGGNVY